MNKRFQVKILLTLLCTMWMLLLLSACGNKIEQKELIGQYVWNDGRLDTLELRADGTYEYWTIQPGRKVANSGTWKFNSLLNEIEFENENFPFLTNHAGGSWFSRLQLKDREIHLLHATDPAIYLKQIKGSEPAQSR